MQPGALVPGQLFIVKVLLGGYRWGHDFESLLCPLHVLASRHASQCCWRCTAVGKPSVIIIFRSSLPYACLGLPYQPLCEGSPLSLVALRA